VRPATQARNTDVWRQKQKESKKMNEASELKPFKVTYKTTSGKESTCTVKARDEKEAKAKCRSKPNYAGNAVVTLKEDDNQINEGYKIGDMVNVTNSRATPRYKIVGKTKTHYEIEKPNGETMMLPKKRIARVNKAGWDLAKSDSAQMDKRMSAITTESQ
jgi:hypothetical protein